MKKIFEIGIPTGLMAVVLLCVFSGSLQAQEEEPTDALLQMVVDLVSDEDPDMRTLGLQQVRDEAPGEAATKAFAGEVVKRQVLILTCGMYDNVARFLPPINISDADMDLALSVFDEAAKAAFA